jgi:hypothetical protein
MVHNKYDDISADVIFLLDCDRLIDLPPLDLRHTQPKRQITFFHSFFFKSPQVKLALERKCDMTKKITVLESTERARNLERRRRRLLLLRRRRRARGAKKN